MNHLCSIPVNTSRLAYQFLPRYLGTVRLRKSRGSMDFSTNGAKQAVSHDTHAIPPLFIQKAYRHYQKVKREDLENDPLVIDFGRGLSEDQKATVKPVGSISAAAVEAACKAYRNSAVTLENDTTPLHTPVHDVTIYEHQEFPGLQIVPGLLPPETQILFTSQLMHRYLADPAHKINLQPDYDIPYPPERKPRKDQNKEPKNGTETLEFDSFFTYPQSSPATDLIPKEPSTTNKPLNTAQFLSTKLRWLTLGTQYDWPTRSYRKDDVTSFPSDLAKLVTGLFPHIRPESGVVLMYGGKDFMPVHRDVSEQCERALASFSLGCDGIFVVAKGEDDGTVETNNQPRTVAIRVRSGDCIHLDGETRWAWHAMARTIPATTPSFLAPWPVGTPGATGEEKRAYEKWKGYMSGKRLNISCRQVWD